jgi:hypothetical protein
VAPIRVRFATRPGWSAWTMTPAKAMHLLTRVLIDIAAKRSLTPVGCGPPLASQSATFPERPQFTRWSEGEKPGGRILGIGVIGVEATFASSETLLAPFRNVPTFAK